MRNPLNQKAARTLLILLSNLSQATKEGVDRLNRLHDDSECRRIENWLCTVDYGAQQSDFINRREEGTGLWLLESNSFQNWVSGDERTLFCPGIPGAGKTIITSVVIDFLWNKFRADGNVGIAYLYCSYTRQQEQKLVDLMSCILLQLMRAQSDPPRHVLNMCLQHMQKGTRPSVVEIVEAIHSVVAQSSRTFMIVDALDECSNEGRVRDNLLDAIFRLQDQYSISFLATSRSLPGIVTKFQGKVCTSLEIRASDHDVRRYLERHITLLPTFVLRNGPLQESIQREIAQSVDGMLVSDDSDGEDY